MDIYLMRHGETDYNRQRRMQGVTDIPLNAYGIELAKRTAEGMKDIPFDRIYTSPLVRAMRTAQIIRGEREIEIVPADSLIEISFGKYEGLTLFPDASGIPNPAFASFFYDPENYDTPPGGESIQHLRERTSSFVRSVMDDPENAGRTFLMVSHGTAIRGILSSLQNLPIGQFWGGEVHKNCGVTKLHVENREFNIEFENRVFY